MTSRIQSHRMPENLYFITTNAVYHAHIFKRDVIKRILVDSLHVGRVLGQYKLFAFVIMPNHVHFLLQSQGKYTPATIMREYKKSTANLILRHYECEGNTDTLWALAEAVKNPGRKNFAVWDEGFHVREIFSKKFLMQKLHYIHHNPLQSHWQLAESPESYVWSSARFYAGAGRSLIPLSDVRELMERRITDVLEDGLGSSSIRDAAGLDDATLSRHRRLKRRKGVYYARKLRSMAHAYARGDLTLDALNASVQGWANHVRYGNTTGLRKAIFRSTPLTLMTREQTI